MKELDVQGTAIQETRTKIIIAAAKELGLSTQWNNIWGRIPQVSTAADIKVKLFIFNVNIIMTPNPVPWITVSLFFYQFTSIYNFWELCRIPTCSKSILWPMFWMSAISELSWDLFRVFSLPVVICFNTDTKTLCWLSCVCACEATSVVSDSLRSYEL